MKIEKYDNYNNNIIAVHDYYVNDRQSKTGNERGSLFPINGYASRAFYASFFVYSPRTLFCVANIVLKTSAVFFLRLRRF